MSIRVCITLMLFAVFLIGQESVDARGYVIGYPEMPIACMRHCSLVGVPVCGTDGNTYDSDCELKNAICNDPSIQLASEGPCEIDITRPCSRQCPMDVWNPVCGSDASDCHLKVAHCRNRFVVRAYEGECDPDVTRDPDMMD